MKFKEYMKEDVATIVSTVALMIAAGSNSFLIADELTKGKSTEKLVNFFVDFKLRKKMKQIMCSIPT